MGTYYEIVNLDKKEVISLGAVANIKAGAFECFSPQLAILTHFLGFNARGIDLLGFEGRWAQNRIIIANDGADYPWDEEDLPDAGMLFLFKLHSHGRLSIWAERNGLWNHGINTPNEWLDDFVRKGIAKWGLEDMSREFPGEM